MKNVLFAGLAFGALTIATLVPASAQGGCGPFGHRGWDGACHSSGGPGPVFGYGHHNGYGYRENPWHREARIRNSEERRAIVGYEHRQRRHFVEQERAQRYGY